MVFWKNPEFIRHVRAELRAPRAITMAALTLVICGLVALSCWGAADHPADFFRLLHFFRFSQVEIKAEWLQKYTELK